MAEKYEIRDAQTTPTLNVTHYSLDGSQEKDRWPHLIDLDLTSVCRGPVEVILGTDVFKLIVPREVVEGPPGTPCAVRTLLGWTLTGHVPRRSAYRPDDRHVHHVQVSDERSAFFFFSFLQVYCTKYSIRLRVSHNKLQTLSRQVFWRKKESQVST